MQFNKYYIIAIANPRRPQQSEDSRFIQNIGRLLTERACNSINNLFTDFEMGSEEEEGAPLAVPISQAESSSLVNSPAAAGVTIITGYLGAGKSTLVNYVLKANHGKRIAVILNEFGEEVGVERALISEGEEGSNPVVEEWVELPNGCVCCTVKHSFVQALEELMAKRQRFDHILLETTGLANPGPVASLLWLDDELESSVRLDSIITVVDAKNLRLQLSEQREGSELPEAYLQIAFADVVLLNKVDLIVEEHEGIAQSVVLEDLKGEIQNINSLARIICTVRCQVDLHDILDCKAYDAKHVARLEALLAESNLQSNSHNHDSEVKTMCVAEQGSMVIDQVNAWLEELLWERKGNMEVYRCKGVLNILGSDEVHIIQAVRELYEIIPGRKWKAGENRINKIVFIGRKLDVNILSTSLNSCLAR